MTSLQERLQAVQARIQTLPTKQAVHLVAVSKGQSSETVRAVFALGQTQFGENYLQEALPKQQALSDLPICWHFIGPIQSNKTNAIAQRFDWVHSVERLKIAERLNSARATCSTPLNICIQVNVSGERSKSGVSPQESLGLAMLLADLSHLRLRGLMCIAQAGNDIQQQGQQFAVLRECYSAIRDVGIALDTLSMGMSGDFEAAILQGATLLRIGTAIFGERV